MLTLSMTLTYMVAKTTACSTGDMSTANSVSGSVKLILSNTVSSSKFKI